MTTLGAFSSFHHHTESSNISVYGQSIGGLDRGEALMGESYGTDEIAEGEVMSGLKTD